MTHSLSGVRKASRADGDDTTLTRFVKTEKRGKQHSKVLDTAANPSIEAGRSIFHQRGVKPPEGNVLVSGHNNVKIGRDVRTGRFKGYWIYTLSLEERATCPRSCHHWQDCYGNNMPFAKRNSHADPQALKLAIEANIERLLSVRGREGILIRLHALGDFFSRDYVWFWDNMLRKYPNLAVYGYTAHEPTSFIGRIIKLTKRDHDDRFRIRWSDAGLDEDCTVSVTNESDCPNTAFVCPEQTGRTTACATCGACWTGKKNVAFIAH